MTLADDQLLFECGLDIDPQIGLSWKLIECKLMYYRPDLVHKSWHEKLRVSDADYDELESLYSDSYTTDMVGIDISRPSVRLAISKYTNPKGKL